MRRLFALLFLIACGAPAVVAQTDPSQRPAGQLRNASLQTVISLYATDVRRTALIAPNLPKVTFTFDVPVALVSDVARILADELAAKDILAIPDGRKFVMIVPRSWEKTVQPLSAQLHYQPLSKTNHLIKGGEIVLHSAPAEDVLPIYARLANAKYEPPSKPLPPDTKISFGSFNPLTREDTMYALRTLLLWNRVKIVFLAPDRITAEPIP